MQGCPATSMQWGAWGGTGMAVVHNLLPRIVQSGLGVLTPARGVAALEALLSMPHRLTAQLVVSPFEWGKLMAGAHHVFPVSCWPAQSSHLTHCCEFPAMGLTCRKTQLYCFRIDCQLWPCCGDWSAGEGKLSWEVTVLLAGVY